MDKKYICPFCKGVIEELKCEDGLVRNVCVVCGAIFVEEDFDEDNN